MFWNKSLVTVKRLHREQSTSVKVNLLIRENDYIVLVCEHVIISVFKYRCIYIIDTIIIILLCCNFIK